MMHVERLQCEMLLLCRDIARAKHLMYLHKTLSVLLRHGAFAKCLFKTVFSH